jgi:hypothetical protein
MEEDTNQEGNEEVQPNFSQQMQIPTEETYLGDPLLSQVSSSSPPSCNSSTHTLDIYTSSLLADACSTEKN